MPQIGWFELLIIVVIAILVIGPKEFPIVLRKVGNWIGSIKKYFSANNIICIINVIIINFKLYNTERLTHNGERVYNTVCV